MTTCWFTFKTDMFVVLYNTGSFLFFRKQVISFSRVKHPVTLFIHLTWKQRNSKGLHTEFTLVSPLSLHLSVSISLFIQSLPFPRLPHLLVSFSVWCLSLSLDGFVSPGINQLPDKQLLDEGSPRVFGVTAVSRSAIHLDHCAELQRVDLRKKTVRHYTDCQNRHGGQCFCWKKRKIYICINKKNVFVSQKE